MQQESHDGGVDLIAEHTTTKDILCIQSKYTIPDKDAIDNVISKFEGFAKTRYQENAGPLDNATPFLYFRQGALWIGRLMPQSKVR